MDGSRLQRRRDCTPPAGDGAEPAATADKRKAAVDAAKAFVSEYHANAAAVKYKKSRRWHWLHVNQERVRALLPTLDEVAKTDPSLAWTAATLCVEYSAHQRAGEAFKIAALDAQKRFFAAHRAALDAAFARETAKGRVDAPYREWFSGNLKKLSDADAIATIKAEARALAATGQTPARDAFLQELLTTLAVLQRIQ